MEGRACLEDGRPFAGGAVLPGRAKSAKECPRRVEPGAGERHRLEETKNSREGNPLIVYTVEPGDSLYRIGRRYGVSIDALRQSNQLMEDQALVPGQALVIPAEFMQHTVQPGESLYSIARQHGTTVERLLALNPSIRNPARIDPGQIIAVPQWQEPSRSILVNGYAYPNISNETLQKTWPILSWISPFSHSIRADGSITPLEDRRIILAAYRNDTAPILVLTNLKPGGGFDSALAAQVLGDPALRATLLDNVAVLLDEKNYMGLDIDFEYIPAGSREDYNTFVRSACERFQPLGYTVSTALAPKTSDDQPGLLYQGHDYAFHGKWVDHVILMTYEWGYTYGPPMAVAPIYQVERVLRYAVEEIPSEKILMGMNNYGYDWILPYEQGRAARSISNAAAVRLAAQKGAVIEYDRRSQAPYFFYYDEMGREHVVWFEDARSISARLKLVEKYDLGGVSYWTINNFFAQNAAVLQSMYFVEKVF